MEHNKIMLDFNSKGKLTSYIKLPLDYYKNKELLDNDSLTPRIKIKRIIFGNKNIEMKNDKLRLNFLSGFFCLEEQPIIEYSNIDFYN